MDNYDWLCQLTAWNVITIIHSQLSTLNLKHGKLPCERPCFTRWKAVFWKSKDGLLQTCCSSYGTALLCRNGADCKQAVYNLLDGGVFSSIYRHKNKHKRTLVWYFYYLCTVAGACCAADIWDIKKRYAKLAIGNLRNFLMSTSVSIVVLTLMAWAANVTPFRAQGFSQDLLSKKWCMSVPCFWRL